MTITALNESDVEKLLAIAATSKNRRARICFHDSEDQKQQFMLICLFNNSKVGVHRHPIGKSEGYVLYRGLLDVVMFDDHGDEIHTIRLTPSSPSAFITQGSFHEPRSVTDYCMYFEFYPGPFIKDFDVEYLANL